MVRNLYPKTAMSGPDTGCEREIVLATPWPTQGRGSCDFTVLSLPAPTIHDTVGKVTSHMSPSLWLDSHPEQALDAAAATRGGGILMMLNTI
jgi:hypothetical protein